MEKKVPMNDMGRKMVVTIVNEHDLVLLRGHGCMDARGSRFDRIEMLLLEIRQARQGQVQAVCLPVHPLYVLAVDLEALLDLGSDPTVAAAPEQEGPEVSEILIRDVEQFVLELLWAAVRTVFSRLTA
ncbi:hypothetical protein DL770_008749 [Monosporascus sp. CRB-9-2]|nr:hypothetical protein DL770_008749 [Monosporascus sp. CRB-9-2]